MATNRVLTAAENEEWECYEGDSWSFDACGLCRCCVEHTVAEHEASADRAWQAEQRAEAALYRHAERVYNDEERCS